MQNYPMYIDGQWCDAESKATFDAINPATGVVFDKIAKGSRDDAVSKGAKIVAGGKRPDLPGYFYEPTVLVDFSIDALVNKEETFGPIAPIASFKDEPQAWQYINACDLELVSSVFTKDIDRAWHWAEKLNTGMTVVNDWQHFWEHHLPFGGMASNNSGLGRVGGRHTLKFMSDLKTIVFSLDGPSVDASVWADQ